MEHAGISFPGRQEVKKIMGELERQRKARYDVVLNSSKLTMKALDNQLTLEIDDPKKGRLLVPYTRKVALQMAQAVGISTSDRAYRWMTTGLPKAGDKPPPAPHFDKAIGWRSFCTLYNDFFRWQRKDYLVRCMQAPTGSMYCRALLSAAYEVVPNYDFFMALVEALDEVKAEVWHARLSESGFRVYAVAQGVSEQVRTDRPFDPGDGWKSLWYGKEGDVLNPAVGASNSEIGEGGCDLSIACLRRVCVNYCVWQDVVSKVHVGKRHQADTILSDETLTLRNREFFSRLKDHVRAAFNPEKFKELIGNMNKATQDVVPDGEKAAEALQLVYEISDERMAAIRNRFIRNRDHSMFGLSNAITEAAHADEKDPDAGWSMEHLGARVLTVPAKRLFEQADKVRKEKEPKAAAVASA